MHHPTDRIAHTTAFVTPVVEHWLEREIAQWVHLMKDRSDDPLHHERTLLPPSYISLPPFILNTQSTQRINNKSIHAKRLRGTEVSRLINDTTWLLFSQLSDKRHHMAAVGEVGGQLDEECHWYDAELSSFS